MRRFLLIFVAAITPVLALTTVGCHHQKIQTFDQRESIHESEPETVSPGEPIVE
jgi:hypothetical protein